MDSGLESAGALATAAAAASSIDPPAARRTVDGGACLNCGEALSGAYCSNCGQKAHIHRSVLHATEEFLHGIVHFDGRLWNTLPLLVLRPGKLTRDYVLGKRARYIAPVALFLLTIFTMFLLFGFLPGPRLNDATVELTPASRQQAATDLRTEISALDTRILELEAKAAKAPTDSALAQELATARASRGIAEVGRRRLAGEGSGDIFDLIRSEVAAGNINVALGNPVLEQKARRALEDPEFVFYKIKQKGYKLSFLLVPLSLPWMMLLFAGKRGVHVYDHVAFLLYSISFMSILTMLAALAAAAGVGSPVFYTILLLAIPVAHMFAQLKEGYALSWFSAAWRTTVLAICALLTLSAYFISILLLGLLD